MHHPCGTAGLIANIIGSFMLLYFPPDTQGYPLNGARRVRWVKCPTKEKERQYRTLRDGFKLGFWLLLLGFFLQLLDLLIAP